MAFTYAWDTDFGNNPEDSESRRYGAQQIRKLKDALSERLQVDHEFGEEVIGSGVDNQTDTGYHKHITLKKVAGGPTVPVAGYAKLGYDTTNNTVELYPEGGAKRSLDGPPIGTIVGVHPSVNVAKAINTAYWKLCDGSGTFKFTYLDGTQSVDIATPLLNDSRFMLGGTSLASGGSNTLLDHTHTCGGISDNHTHGFSGTVDGANIVLVSFATGGNNGIVYSGGASIMGNHTHTFSGDTGTVSSNHTHAIGSGSAPTSTSSLPKYFTVLPYMRIK